MLADLILLYPLLLLDNDMNITHISQDISKENVSILSTNDNKYNELIIKLQDLLVYIFYLIFHY